MEQSRRAETKRTSETLANTDETGCEQQRRSKSAQEEQPSIEHGGSLSDAASGGRPEVWWKVEPPVGRVVDGLPNRVPQLRALGNSIIPQIAQEIGNAIKALENDKEV
jgi:hypothetical protein